MRLRRSVEYLKLTGSVFLALLLLLYAVSGGYEALADETSPTAPQESVSSENETEESREAEAEASSEVGESSEESSAEPEPEKPRKPYRIPCRSFDLIPETESLRMLTVRDCAELYMREGPGYEYEELALVQKAMALRVLGEASSAAGELWYLVDAGLEIDGEPVTGYLDARDCKVITLQPGDDAYGIYLRQLGFPESYIPGLSALHAEYPDWVFVAHDTGIYWEDVLREESNPLYYPGISLIHPYQISSWKSVKPGHYNWATSTYTNYDGSWNAASEAIVAYFLDPRNFLDDSAVFLFLDQCFNDSQTIAGVEQIVAGTFMEAASVTDTDGTVFYYPQTIYDIGKELGVSPYFLACCIRQEIGVAGTSKSISGTSSKYPGYYNYFNVYAYTTQDEDANDHGLWFAAGQGFGATSYNRPWNTRLRSLKGGAMYLGGNYILVGQNTLYYKRFNVTNKSAGLYRHQYMTNIMGAYSEAVSLSRAYDAGSRQQPLIFDIPYYYQMPEAACEKPTADGCPNNKLADISLENCRLSPAFDMDTERYNAILDGNTSSVLLQAVPCNDTALVDIAKLPPETAGTAVKDEDLDYLPIGGGGLSLSLQEGTAQYRLRVKAENGDVRYYSLVLYCEPESGGSMQCVYPVSEEGLMTGIRPGTKTEEFTANLGLASGMRCSLLTAEGREKETGSLMMTGDSVKVYKNDAPYFEGRVLIYGDVNGDGKISIFDILDIRDFILETRELRDAAQTAADVTRDGRISIFDILDVRDHILNEKSIRQ